MPCHRRLFVIAVILLLAAGGWATVHRRGRQARETPLRAATALEAAIAAFRRVLGQALVLLGVGLAIGLGAAWQFGTG